MFKGYTVFILIFLLDGCRVKAPSPLSNVEVIYGEAASKPLHATVLILTPLSASLEKVAALCTGAILKETYLITAAHCVLNDKNQLLKHFDSGGKFWITQQVDLSRAAENNRNKRILTLAKIPEKTEVQVLSKTLVAPHYTMEKVQNSKNRNAPDIAVVKIKIGKRIQEAFLRKEFLKDEEHVVYGGYGCTTEKEKKLGSDFFMPPRLHVDKDVQVISVLKHDKNSDASFNKNYFLSSNKGQGSTQTCAGDSGMPLYDKNNHIVGIHYGTVVVNTHSRVGLGSDAYTWLNLVLPTTVFK